VGPDLEIMNSYSLKLSSKAPIHTPIMRILFLIRSMNYGGAERQLVALATGLKEIGHRVVVAVFYSGGPLQEELERADICVQGLGKRRRWDVRDFFVRLLRLVHQEQPDVIHSYLVVPNILSTVLKIFSFKTKIVWGVRASNVDLTQYDWFSNFTYRVEPLLSYFPDLIIVNSQAGLGNAVRQGFPKGKMVVVPNGIDTLRFAPNQGARDRQRALWQVKDHDKLIGLVGRLDPMKGHRTFLEAAAKVKEGRRGVKFVCVGDGTAAYREGLEAAGEHLGLKKDLIWAGTCSDIAAVYNALDICVSSSFGEGFPNVVGEAMACGVPCVVTDVGDSAWIVGDTGIVVPPKDPEALAQGLEVMLDRMSGTGSFPFSGARKRICSEFDLSRLVKRTSEVLETLCD
jgi:glycosyltransferase involved in cell wall biosynthesis